VRSVAVSVTSPTDTTARAWAGSHPATLAGLKQRTGGGAVPVLEIDGTLLRPGFSERSVERALVASVERRLGVRGLHLEAH
jgi:hypothetical protein